jgi:hypothetical protein
MESFPETINMTELYDTWCDISPNKKDRNLFWKVYESNPSNDVDVLYDTWCDISPNKEIAALFWKIHGPSLSM